MQKGPEELEQRRPQVDTLKSGQGYDLLGEFTVLGVFPSYTASEKGKNVFTAQNALIRHLKYLIFL